MVACSPINKMGGTYARLLSNLTVFIGAVKSNNRYIMQLWFGSDERAEGSTKGQGQMPLRLTTTAAV